MRLSVKALVTDVTTIVILLVVLPVLAGHLLAH